MCDRGDRPLDQRKYSSVKEMKHFSPVCWSDTGLFGGLLQVLKLTLLILFCLLTTFCRQWKADRISCLILRRMRNSHSFTNEFPSSLDRHRMSNHFSGEKINPKYFWIYEWRDDHVSRRAGTSWHCTLGHAHDDLRVVPHYAWPALPWRNCVPRCVFCRVAFKRRVIFGVNVSL